MVEAIFDQNDQHAPVWSFWRDESAQAQRGLRIKNYQNYRPVASFAFSLQAQMDSGIMRSGALGERKSLRSRGSRRSAA